MSSIICCCNYFSGEIEKLFTVENGEIYTRNLSDVLEKRLMCQFDCEINENNINISYHTDECTYYFDVVDDIIVQGTEKNNSLQIIHYQKEFGSVFELIHEQRTALQSFDMKKINFIDGPSTYFKIIDLNGETLEKMEFNKINQKLKNSGTLIKHIPSGHYLVVSHNQLKFKMTNEIESDDSFLFLYDHIYSSVEFYTIHNDIVGHLSLDKLILFYTTQNLSKDPICLNDNGQLTNNYGQQITLEDGTLMTIAMIPYSEHMDKNFEYTEFQNGELIRLRLINEPKYLTCFSGFTWRSKEEVSIESTGRTGLADTNRFRIMERNGKITIVPYWIGQEPIDVSFRDLNGGFLYADQNKIIYTKNTMIEPNIGVKSMGLNKIILFDIKSNQPLTPTLIKQEVKDTDGNSCFDENIMGGYGGCPPSYKGSIRSEIVPKKVMNYVFIPDYCVKLKSKYGYLAITEDGVSLNNEGDKFMIQRLTCTLVMLISCYKGSRVGAIYGFADGLEFIENLECHPNTFIERDKLSDEFVIRIKCRGESDRNYNAKYVCYDQKLVVSMGRPVKFTCECAHSH